MSKSKEYEIPFVISFLFILLTFGFILFLIVEIKQTVDTNHKILTQMERFEMYDKDLKDYTKKTINGVYHTPNYYCVWTEGRTDHQIDGTDVHERCHDLIYDDREHFCGGKTK